MASASGAMAKHEQILVLDPPSDLKFKGRQAGARPSGAGAGGRAGERRRRRGGPAVLPSPPPRRGRASVGAAAPLRPSAPRLAVLRCRAGLRRGGEGAGRAPRRAQPGAAAAILRPAGAPRDLARALPARMASLPQGGRGTVGSSRGGAVREGDCESRSSGLCGRPPARPRVAFGGFGQAPPAGEAFPVAASLGGFPGLVRDSAERGDPAVPGWD